MRACISATAMDQDELNQQDNSFQKSEESDRQENEEQSSQFLRPFLSGCQKVWNSRRKWFGAGPSSPDCVQDQPKILGRVDVSPGEQQQSFEKDPGLTLQVKYRRMSLKRTSGRGAENLPARMSLGATNLPSRREEDERPLSQVHTQVDYTNFLIPGQTEIIHCPFYWGKIDRYEAEALLANKPEGSFLLRDSAQDDFVFSVSFRRYSRSLHARIEEANHHFSFDCHDPGVHSASTVRGLLEHYRDPHSCMFFEPLLLYGVPRNTCFSLQSLARGAVCDQLQSYGDVSQLPIPKTLKQYLREYHYKHKLRTRHVELVS